MSRASSSMTVVVLLRAAAGNACHICKCGRQDSTSWRRPGWGLKGAQLVQRFLDGGGQLVEHHGRRPPRRRRALPRSRALWKGTNSCGDSPLAPGALAAGRRTFVPVRCWAVLHFFLGVGINCYFGTDDDLQLEYASGDSGTESHDIARHISSKIPARGARGHARGGVMRLPRVLACAMCSKEDQPTRRERSSSW